MLGFLFVVLCIVIAIVLIVRKEKRKAAERQAERVIDDAWQRAEQVSNRYKVERNSGSTVVSPVKKREEKVRVDPIVPEVLFIPTDVVKNSYGGLIAEEKGVDNTPTFGGGDFGGGGAGRSWDSNDSGGSSSSSDYDSGGSSDSSLSSSDF